MDKLNNIEIKAMYRYEIARYAGVSVRTLNRWISSDKELEKKVNQHKGLIPASIVKEICDKYVIFLKNEKEE
ncbi:MAG: hypothetical protein J6C20_03480 [Paludibacteraceae bacterium]|nr:hypothetical protein [Paludibacteraceae bacterium]